MASDYACDTQDGNLATISVSNMQDGSVQFLCTPCAGLFGVTLIRELYPDMWAEIAAPPTPPAKATPAKRGGPKSKGKLDPGEPVATITETGPRDSDEHPTDATDRAAMEDAITGAGEPIGASAGDDAPPY